MYIIAIRYFDGKLDLALAKMGKNVSRKIKAIDDFPKEIKIRPFLVVHGELFATEEEPISS